MTYERRGFIETNLIAICERPNVEAIPVANGSLMEGERIEYLQKLSLDELAKSDFAHCELERPRLWTTVALFHRQDANGHAVVDQHGTLTGWVLVRMCELGYRFGPLYAERQDIANLRVHAAMESLEDKGASLIAETWQ